MVTESVYNSIEPVLNSLITGIVDPHHSRLHIDNVMNNALAIADIVDPQFKIVDRNLLKICVLTHDLSYIENTSGLYSWFYEGRLVVEALNKYLPDLPITQEEKLIVIEAIRKHPHSFPFRRLNKKGNIYTQILQDADTIDLFSIERVAAVTERHFPETLDRFVIWLGGKIYGRVGAFLNLAESKTYIYNKEVLSKLSTPSDFDYGEWNPDCDNVILCIHGYANSYEMFSGFADHVKEDYSVVSVNLPTLSNKGVGYTVQELAAYIIKFCEVVNIKPNKILGFSFGGIVGIEICRSNKIPLEEYIMLCSFPELFPRQSLFYKVLDKANILSRCSLITFIFSRIRLVVDLFRSRLSTDSKWIIKKFHSSIYQSLISGIQYPGIEVYNRLEVSRRIILYRDDTVLKLKWLRENIKRIKGDVLIRESGGHGLSTDFWEQVSSLL